LEVAQKYFSAGAAVTVCLMVVQADAVTVTNIVKFMAYTGVKPSAQLHGAGIGDHPKSCVNLQYGVK
jgi:hypothetical protein